MGSCNICGKKSIPVFDLKTVTSEQCDILLISLIENLTDEVEFIQNIALVCKDCKELLLELDTLRSRSLEIENILKGFIIDRKQTLKYLSNSRNTGNDHALEKKEFFENADSTCSKINDTLLNLNASYSDTKAIDVNKSVTIKKKIKTQKYTNTNPKFVYECHCEKTFRTNNELKKHYRTHDSERPYVCEICGQAYKQKTGFDIHMKMHEGLNPFTCIYCNKSFTQKVALIRHVPMHTGEKPYQCDECGKRFTHHTSFSAHKLIHTGQKPFKCPHCNEAFRSSSHLTRHKRVHTGEKKYGCYVCGKHFAERYNLVVHEKIHGNSTENIDRKGKHFCQICGERFERPAKLEEHKVKKHLSVTPQHTLPLHESVTIRDVNKSSSRNLPIAILESTILALMNDVIEEVLL